MKNDKTPIEILDDDVTRADDRQTEVPVIIIERDTAEPLPDPGNHPVPPRRHKWLMPLMVIIIVVLTAIAFLFWYQGNRSSRLDVPVAVTDEENIIKLEAPFSPSANGVTITSDSILGVAMDFYSLDGMAASLEYEIPDTLDKSLMLFCRSADYRPDNSALGSMVVNGKTSLDKRGYLRPAYLAIATSGKPVIGVSASDKVMDHIEKTGGSFFRQQLLLSDASLPRKFDLHGKVERAAIARMEDDKLYYILTRHKETMYDFADAMREYGFVDAIYITGGNAYSFYRDHSGAAHVDSALIAKINKYNDSKLPTPLLVFRSSKQ